MKKLFLGVLSTSLLVSAEANASCEADPSQDAQELALAIAAAAKVPCGLKGSVEARIKDCSWRNPSGSRNPVLVTKTSDISIARSARR